MRWGRLSTSQAVVLNATTLWSSDIQRTLIWSHRLRWESGVGLRAAGYPQGAAHLSGHVLRPWREGPCPTWAASRLYDPGTLLGFSVPSFLICDVDPREGGASRSTKLVCEALCHFVLPQDVPSPTKPTSSE